MLFQTKHHHGAYDQVHVHTFGLWIVQKSYNRYENRQHYKLDLSLLLRQITEYRYVNIIFYKLEALWLPLILRYPKDCS
jgi:hypothetical protein